MSPIKKSNVSKANPVAKKPATASAAAAAAQPRKRAVRATKATAPAPIQVTPEERKKMIELAAYYRAEKVGFTGDPQQHWAEAEKEVDAMLKAGIRPASK
jgi:hypothetical protein